MRGTKRKILEYIGTVGMVTHFHTVCFRDLKTPKTTGYNMMRSVARIFLILERDGLIRRIATPLDEIEKRKYRYHYYELTKKAGNLLDIEDYKPKGRFSPDQLFAHQYGLQTIISSLYFNSDFPMFKVDYPTDNKELGYRPDAIIDTGKCKLIIEHEKSRSMEEMIKVVLHRDSLVNRNGYKFVYIFNVNRHKSFVDPVAMYIKDSPYEKSVDQFLKDFLAHPKIKALPSWKFRFQTLHNFEKFGDGIFYAPGKKETYKL